MIRRHVLQAIFKRNFLSYFGSPTGYVFIAVFVIVSAGLAFCQDAFFTNNLANLQQLNRWFSVLLVFFVPAVTMALWAEERKQGTLEVLLTLPARDHELVAGKFLASWALLAGGLALTLALPVGISLLGRLDWGPVVGGYVGALLLGAAYLAVGQLLSASTENQILAFILAMVVCLALYGVGTEAFAGLFADRTASVLRAVGTGSRFQSIARGVIDMRDLCYYLSLTLFFLAGCTFAVRARRWT
jgi:ABC-2 type transport system permease protein